MRHHTGVTVCALRAPDGSAAAGEDPPPRGRGSSAYLRPPRQRLFSGPATPAAPAETKPPPPLAYPPLSDPAPLRGF